MNKIKPQIALDMHGNGADNYYVYLSNPSYAQAFSANDLLADYTSLCQKEYSQFFGTEYKPLSKSVDLTSLEEQIASKASLDEVTAKIDSEIAKIDAAGTAESKVSEHNVSDAAHNDIRLLVQGLTERLNALADSDDTTLDQMSEVVAYIKSNKSLIDAITTSKINVSDIIDNLTTNVSNKPLSAAQGVKLKALIDEITTVELDETLTDNTKAAPAGMVGELKGDFV